MKKYPYKKVNAFTSENSLGNPAAYLLTGDDCLSHKKMLEVGKEHGGFVSEVVFCSDSNEADVELTYYSSECEVDFCGHGTIAVMYDLIKNNEQFRQKKEILIKTNKKGFLTVYNDIDKEDAVYITAPMAQHLTIPVSTEKVAAALGVDVLDLSTKHPFDFIDAGLRTLIVPLSSFYKVVSIYPDESKLKKFCMDIGIDIILIFSMEASSIEYIAHTRVFAPKFGYLEDPATGSGNSAFGNYLLKNNMWDGSGISIEQGGDNIIFNTIKLKQNKEDVLFGGKASVQIEGQYYINEL